MKLPEGFNAYVANIGIKDSSTDFTLVVADTRCAASGVFTQSRFAGPTGLTTPENNGELAARAVVVISKNANVATGAEGMRNAREVVNRVAKIAPKKPRNSSASGRVSKSRATASGLWSTRVC
ncbi:MAG: bifunctional ornithine acetyltransferase/N-acetylglutamate synthase [Actinomycetota bacterium]